MNKDDPDWAMERKGEHLWQRRERAPERENSEQTETIKKRWSIFDIFRRDREDEAEEERVERDKELKKAAKLHARSVIEPEPEERADDETRKVKKKWRHRLFARSRRQAEDLRAKEAETGGLDGPEIARLMVAERLLQLDHFLQTPDLAKEDKKAIKIHIDFMGLLSDKLENPSYPMPPQIEAIYEHISTPSPEEHEAAPTSPVASTTAMDTRRLSPVLSREPTPDHVPSAEAVAKPAVYGAFVAGMIAVVRKAFRHNEAPEVTASPGIAELPQDYSQDDEEQQTPAPSISTRPVSGVSYQRHTPAASGPRPEASWQSSDLLGATVSVYQSHETLRRELQGSATDQMERVIERVDERHYQLPAALPPEMPETPQRHTLSTAKVPRQNQSPAPDAASESVPSRPVESWSISQLLSEAEHTPLGHGRYLRHAYEHGEIDRAGLVRIIKEKIRGNDYAQEFIRQREALRHKRASPEHLSPPHINPATETPLPSVSPAQAAAKRIIRGKTLPPSIISTKDLLSSLRRGARQPGSIFFPKTSVTASLLIALAVTVAAILMMLSFG